MKLRSSRRMLFPTAVTARLGSYIEDHGIHRTADAHIHLRAFELGLSGDVRHCVRRVVRVPEPALSRHLDPDCCRDVDVGRRRCLIGRFWWGRSLGRCSANSVSFWLGHRYGGGIGRIWPFTRNPDLLPNGIRFFQKHGGKSVFIGRFFGPVRAVIPLAAGIMRMRRGRFWFANVTSAIVWAPMLLFAGDAVGDVGDRADRIRQYGIARLWRPDRVRHHRGGVGDDEVRQIEIVREDEWPRSFHLTATNSSASEPAFRMSQSPIRGRTPTMSWISSLRATRPASP